MEDIEHVWHAADAAQEWHDAQLRRLIDALSAVIPDAGQITWSDSGEPVPMGDVVDEEEGW